MDGRNHGQMDRQTEVLVEIVIAIPLISSKIKKIVLFMKSVVILTNNCDKNFLSEKKVRIDYHLGFLHSLFGEFC